MACKTALRRLDLSELLRRESESAAETAENDSCKSQAALHASEAARRAAEAALRALDSPRRSSDRSSFPISVWRTMFAFVCSSRIALVSLSHRSVANSFIYGDTTGRIGPRYGWAAARRHRACRLLLLLLLLACGCFCCWSSLGVGCFGCWDGFRAHVRAMLIDAATHKRNKT